MKLVEAQKDKTPCAFVSNLSPFERVSSYVRYSPKTTEWRILSRDSSKGEQADFCNSEAQKYREVQVRKSTKNWKEVEKSALSSLKSSHIKASPSSESGFQIKGGG